MKHIKPLFILLTVLLIPLSLYTSSLAIDLKLLEGNAQNNQPDFLCGTSTEQQEMLQSALIQKKLNELNEAAGITPYGMPRPHLLPSTGNVRLLVLPIMFADSMPVTDSWETDMEYYQQIFNRDDDGGPIYSQSVHAYFYRQSYGHLNVTADVLPIYFASEPKMNYANGTSADKYVALAKDALATYDIDPDQYDADGDGFIDCFCMIEGKGYVNGHYGGFDKGGWEVFMWDEDFGSLQVGQLVNVPSRPPDKSNAVVDIACHELGHAMGLADNYLDPAVSCYLPELHGDLMGAGTSSDYVNAFYKYLLGWTDPIILTGKSPIQSLELYAVEHREVAYEQEPKAVLYVPDTAELPFTEFFIAEYRNAKDFYDPSSYYVKPGVTLWHCLADINSTGGFAHKLNYLQSVRPTGSETNSDFTTADLFVPQGEPWNEYSTSSVISPNTVPTNSDFENGVSTSFYMEVLDQDTDRAVLRIGAISADGPAQETLSIVPPINLVYGDTDFQLTTTGGSGTGAVTWEVLSGEAVTVTPDGLASIHGVGQCRIKATKAGDDTYPEAVSASYAITVTPKNISYNNDISVRLPSDERLYTGKPYKPIPMVTDSKAIITADDYDVSYGENIGPGYGTITITGKRNYVGKKIVQFVIAASEIIATAEQFQQFADKVNNNDASYRFGHFKLTADIELGGSEHPWTPISYFNGVLDGNGHLISGIYIDSGMNQGLFGRLGSDGIIKNLGVSGMISGNAYLGGIAAKNNGTITNCYNACAVAASLFFAGGIVSENMGTIENCYNVGTVSTVRDGVGGVAGRNFPSGIIKNCYSYASVTGKGALVGGLISENEGTIENCYYFSETINVGTAFGDILGKVEKKTTEQFRTEDSFPGWDFSTVWRMNSVLGRPILQASPESDEHIHTYSSEWCSDDMSHWHECTRCNAIDCNAPHVEDDGIVTFPPTLEVEGAKTYSCAICGKVTRTEILPKLKPEHVHSYGTVWVNDDTGHWHECDCGEKSDQTDHIPVIDPAVPATCITNGKTEGRYCDMCGYMIQPQKTISLLGHEFSDAWISDNIYHWHKCIRCDATDSIIPHVENNGVVTSLPTLETEGTKTYSCIICNQTTRTEVLPKLEPEHIHNYGTAWISDETGHWHECDCGEKNGLADHIPAIDSAVSATCTTGGLTEGSHCMMCGYTLQPQKTIPILEHKFSNSWTANSIYHWHECTRCDMIDGEEPHTENNGIVTVEPTLVTEGVKTYSCTACGQITRTETLPKLGSEHTHSYNEKWEFDSRSHWHKCECGEVGGLAAHTEKEIPAVFPTCMEKGKTTGKQCSVCGYIILAQMEIPATGHNPLSTWNSNDTNHWKACADCGYKVNEASHTWDNGVVTLIPTSTQGGIKTYTCTVCAKTRSEMIPATEGGSSSGSSATIYTISIPAEDKGGSVKATPQKAEAGEVVTLTVEITSDYELEQITVRDRTGKELSIKKVKSGKYTFVMPSSKVAVDAKFILKPVELPPQEEKSIDPEIPLELRPTESEKPFFPFTDVKESTWYYDTVADIYYQGMMVGITETQFAPEIPASRGMAVTILYRIAGSPVYEYSSFSDVPSSSYYAPAIAWAEKNGIAKGYGNGIFQPDRPITREELAMLLYRFESCKGKDMEARTDLSGFVDSDGISQYAADAMSWATAMELISGTDWDGLHPGGRATRAEVATALGRLLKLN